MVLAAVLAEGFDDVGCRLESSERFRQRVRPAAAGAFPQDDAAADADEGLEGSGLRRLH